MLLQKVFLFSFFFFYWIFKFYAWKKCSALYHNWQIHSAHRVCKQVLSSESGCQSLKLSSLYISKITPFVKLAFCGFIDAGSIPDSTIRHLVSLWQYCMYDTINSEIIYECVNTLHIYNYINADNSSSDQVYPYCQITQVKKNVNVFSVCQFLLYGSGLWNWCIHPSVLTPLVFLLSSFYFFINNEFLQALASLKIPSNWDSSVFLHWTLTLVLMIQLYWLRFHSPWIDIHL